MVEAWHHVANAEGRLRRSWCGALALGGGGPAAGSLTRTITYDQGEAHAGQGKKLTVRCACGLHRNVKFLTEESKRVWPRRAYQLLFFVGPQGPECRGGMSEAGSKNQRVWVSCTRDVGCAGKGWPPEFPRCRLGQPSPVCFAGAGATNVETGDRSRRLDASRHAYMRMLRVVK